ncbi:hypothetical protein [uncultured Muribaculum sp.]|uniref:hypothetical protein n=1 Tax=uncultured Muribaculum sp. TaxID=1918613 RepID=UPI0025F47C52|nr:hypothetical protein [uncultured Muribaculum sp.]
MKKSLVLLLLGIVGVLCSYAAETVRVTFNFDNVEAIKKFQVDFKAITPIKESNVIEYELDDKHPLGVVAMVELNDGYIFGNITQTAGGTAPYVGSYYLNLYMQPSDNGVTWNINTIDVVKARTGKMTLNIDNPSKVSVKEVMTSLDYSLVDGENILAFIPDEKNSISIKPTSYYKPIYKVEHNGKEIIADRYGEYVVIPADGDVVNVAADFPDVDLPITFTYDEGAEKVVSSVTVDNVPMTDFDGKSISVKAGGEVFVRLNDEDFLIKGITLNGTLREEKSSFSFYAREATTVHISASSYGDITAWIDVDDPENAIVYEGYAFNNKVISLKPGKNEISMPARSARIAVCHSLKGRVTGISDGTTSYEPGEYNLIQLLDGMTLTVTTAPFVRDDRIVLWVDDCTGASFTFNLGEYEFRTNLGDKIVSGYNEFLIDPEIDNPATLSWYAGAATYNSVFVDGTVLSPIYAGGKSYDLPRLSEGSVIKVFAASDPDVCDVTFDVAAGVSVNVLKDRITSVNDLSNQITVYRGTEVSVIPAGSQTAIGVKCNGVAIDIASDGSYVFVVDGDTAVEISDGTSGIASVDDDSTGTVDVYNLQGICVMRGVSKAETSSLAPGIYIIDGHKVRIE